MTTQSRVETVVRVLIQAVGRQQLDQAQQRSNAADHPPLVKNSATDVIAYARNLQQLLRLDRSL